MTLEQTPLLSSDQAVKFMKIITKYFSGYNFEETHGIAFLQWATVQPDDMGFGKSYHIPLSDYYGDGLSIKIDANHIGLASPELKKELGSRRTAQRWLDGHKALEPLATELGLTVDPVQLAVKPERYGPEIRIGQIWESIAKSRGTHFEVIEAQKKHIVLRRLDTGKNRPCRDNWLANEFKLIRDNPNGDPVSYDVGLLSRDEPTVGTPEEIDNVLETNS